MLSPEQGVNQSKDRDKKLPPVFLISHWRMTGIVAAMAMSLIFGFGAWYALQDAGSDKSVAAKIRLIKAEPGPLKVKPTDPGGLKIPNQDKLVFERITPEVRRVGEEKLAPEPEEPIATSEIAVGKAVPENSDRLIMPQHNKKWKLQSDSTNRKFKNNEKDTLGYKIQLAAFRKEGLAKASWTKLKKTHAEVLGTLVPLTVRVDLGKKGVYFRVQAGYFNMLKNAQSACAKLKTKGQGCIIKRPK